MYRFFAILAGLLISTSASSAATAPKNEVALSQRLSKAQATIAALDELAKANNSGQESSRGSEGKIAQHWHNHHWNNWNNWSNWADHHRRHHH